MLECINKECGSCKENKCNDAIVKPLGYCHARIKPPHMPSYAELVTENEKLRKTNASYYDEYMKSLEALKRESKRLKNELLQQGKSMEELIKESEELKRTNLMLNEKLETIDDEYQEDIKELKEVRNNQSSKIIELENDNEGLREEITKLEDKLENYRLLKRMIKVLIEGL